MTPAEQERCTSDVAEVIRLWMAASPGHPPVGFRVYTAPADEHGPAEDVIELRIARRYIETLDFEAWRATDPATFADLVMASLSNGAKRWRDGVKTAHPGAQVLHVQMSPALLFCGGTSGPAIRCEAWHREPEAVQKATCAECLRVIFMLGDSANLKLARMGMKVEVHDVDESALAEN